MTGERVVGIYDADGGLAGELRYLAGKVTGRAHCALCDITHGWAGRRRSWDRACGEAGVAVELAHRNEATAEQLAAAGALPAVVGGLDGGWRLLLGPVELQRCDGDPEAFVAALADALNSLR
jgi:hypothetical protein